MKQPTLLLTLLLAPLAFAAATTGVRAADLFVSPAGSDRGSGARATPFATLQKARDAARGMPKPVRARKKLIVTNESGIGMLPGCPKPKNLSGSTPCYFRT